MDISVGALTYHHISIKPQHHFERCIGDCQAILNPILDLGFNQHHVFVGANSIARSMVGYRYNIPINNFTNLTAGGYYQNNGEFLKKGITLDYTLGDLIPVVGADMTYKSVGLLVSFPLSVLYWRF